jgi:hypothetical protein
MNKIKTILAAAGCLMLSACADYLDVVPDNIATLDIVFNNRTSAEKYLVNCYSFVPEYASIRDNPGMTAGHETWHYTLFGDRNFNNMGAFQIALGLQNTTAPFNDYWDGEQYAKPMFRAIRECNIFLEYVADLNRVNDLTAYERHRWIAEARVLKAFYHYYLFQLYGPIPIVDTYVPVSASQEEVKVTRASVNEVVDYMVKLIDDNYSNLPERITLVGTEMGRLTQPAALAIKAKILLLAASPLFNGNVKYANFKGREGENLIDQVYKREKWVAAASAAKEAIELARANGHDLYDFNENSAISLPEELRYGMNVRGAVTERFNKELVWSVGKQGTWGTQGDAMACLRPVMESKTVSAGVLQWNCRANYAPTLETAERFYSRNGVPIYEDTEWEEKGYYLNRYNTKAIPTDGQFGTYKLVMKANTDGAGGAALTHTAVLNFEREPRFYGSLGFDGSTWYGHGWYNTATGTVPAPEVNYVDAKKWRESGSKWGSLYSITGYFAKKLVHYENEIGASQQIVKDYPFPIIRLADLYLMYAEALNESTEGDDIHADVYDYLRLVRERAGLKQGVLGQNQDIGDVKVAWTLYSNDPSKPYTKEGMREIIRHERQIELALEGQQYFDLRRWCTAETELSKPVRGWNINGETVEDYYNVTVLYNPPPFMNRDYLWPIKENDLQIDNKLVQTYGW